MNNFKFFAGHLLRVFENILDVIKKLRINVLVIAAKITKKIFNQSPNLGQFF